MPHFRLHGTGVIRPALPAYLGVLFMQIRYDGWELRSGDMSAQKEKQTLGTHGEKGFQKETSSTLLQEKISLLFNIWGDRGGQWELLP